jgi:putative aldouronate transport system permease protein
VILRALRGFLYHLVIAHIIVFSLDSLLVAVFAYYPLYGWFYAFFDYRPPAALSMKDFVGLKWFAYLTSNPVRVQTIFAVLRNTFVMSGITLATSWLLMLFAVFLN